jgi:hypothetical protein
MSDLKIDFLDFVPDTQIVAGWLEKKGNFRQNWTPRYFVLANGVLKYFAKGPDSEHNVLGTEFKSDIPLLGCIVSITKETRLNLQVRGDKKETIILKAANYEEVNNNDNIL